MSGVDGQVDRAQQEAAEHRYHRQVATIEQQRDHVTVADAQGRELVGHRECRAVQFGIGNHAVAVDERRPIRIPQREFPGPPVQWHADRACRGRIAQVVEQVSALRRFDDADILGRMVGTGDQLGADVRDMPGDPTGQLDTDPCRVDIQPDLDRPAGEPADTRQLHTLRSRRTRLDAHGRGGATRPGHELGDGVGQPRRRRVRLADRIQHPGQQFTPVFTGDRRHPQRQECAPPTAGVATSRSSRPP